MPTYVVSSCFMETSCLKPYFSDVLFKFAEQNPLKVGIDKDNIIINLYEQIAENHYLIKSWLDLMSYEPTSFEVITENVDNLADEKEMFLCVCGALVNNKKMIVNTIQNFVEYNVLDDNKIEYCNKIIQILEKDDAVEEFKSDNKNINITDSIVANEGSTIKGVNK